MRSAQARLEAVASASRGGAERCVAGGAVCVGLACPAAVTGTRAAMAPRRGFGDLVGQDGAGRGQRLDPQGRGDRAATAGHAADAAVPAGLAVRGVLQGVLRPGPSSSRSSSRAAASRSAPGFVDRSRGLRGDQQPRHRRCRRDHGHLQRRQRVPGQADRHATPRPTWPCSRSSGPTPFPFVEWADSDQVRVGDWMVAIGNPFGLGSTVTAGIVSARGRDIRAGPYDDFFQVDAADQPRQFGRPELHARRQGVRRQHRHLLALGRQCRHRLRHPVQPRQAGHRQPDEVRQGRARLARACASRA